MEMEEFVKAVKELNLQSGDEITLTWGSEKSKHILNSDFFDWLIQFSGEKKSVGLIPDFNFKEFENSSSVESEVDGLTIFSGKTPSYKSPLKVKLSYTKDYFFVGSDEIHHVSDIEVINRKPNQLL